MEADELQAIRAARAQQLKQEAESGTGDAEENAPSSGGGAQRQDADEARRNILASLLENTARERRVLLIEYKARSVC